MIRDGKKVLFLFLENWQKKMIKDFLNSDCDAWELTFEEGINVMYGSPTMSSAEHKRMYLTDWQMKEVRDELGITCDFIELIEVNKPVRYGLPPE